MATRPETQAPAEIIYNATGAEKYAHNNRMQRIQRRLTERAIELLRLPEAESQLVLDIGCGSGLSGKTLEDMGHRFIGTDISKHMIDLAKRDLDGDMMQHDMGTGLPFRPGSFDAAISISAVQWLCNADRKEHIPPLRMKKFFSSLYSVLRRGARAVLQFYPANKQQGNMIVHHATKAGFSGGLVVDYPHSTKAKKYFLVLFAGPQDPVRPQPRLGNPEDSEEEMDDEEDEEEEEDDEDDEEDSDFGDVVYGDPAASVADSQATCQVGQKRKVHLSERAKKGRSGKRSTRAVRGSKEWIRQKKVQQEKKGQETRKNTKYTGRKRGPKF